MAEHERMTKTTNENANKHHRVKKQESQSLFNKSLVLGQGLLSVTETPFYPRMDEHAKMLSRIPFTSQRNEFILRLHQTYGNRYVQRLLNSEAMQTKLTVSQPRDYHAQWQAEGNEEELQAKPIIQWRVGSTIQKKQVDMTLINQFLKENPGHEDLFTGIEGKMSDFKIINRLLNNFYNRDDFRYTGERKRPCSHEGDCGTLVVEFKTIAEQCFQIETQVGRSTKPIFVSGPKSQIGDNRTGNVDSGQHWIYDEHYWIVFDGKPIDILFGHWGLDCDEGTYNWGRLEYHFNDKVYYFNRKAKDLTDIYTLNHKNRARNDKEIPRFL